MKGQILHILFIYLIKQKYHCLVFKSKSSICILKNAAVQKGLRLVILLLHSKSLRILIMLRLVFSSFVLLTERIWAFPISHSLSAAPLSSGIVQASIDSTAIQCGFLNFKAKWNPMHKRNLNMFHSSLVSQLYFPKKPKFSLINMGSQMHWFWN